MSDLGFEVKFLLGQVVIRTADDRNGIVNAVFGEESGVEYDVRFPFGTERVKQYDLEEFEQ